MANKGSGSGYSTLKAGKEDIKLHIRRLSNFVAVDVEDNMKTTFDVKHLVSDVRFLSYQTSCHDSRIDDHDKDLKELMEKVNFIKEDLQKLA